MAQQKCPVCGRYSDFYPTDKALTDHMLAVHPDDPRTLARTKPARPLAYGVQVGKTKEPDATPQERA